jgi:hypothetical protein
MNFKEYYPLALRTCKMFPTLEQNLRHAVMGMITEAGEMMTGIKRWEIYNKELDAAMRSDLLEELGDFQWYVPVAMMAIGRTELPEVPQIMLDAHRSRLHNAGDYVIALNGLTSAVSITLFTTEQGDVPTPGKLTYNSINKIVAACVMMNDSIESLAEQLCTTGDEVRRLNIEKLRKRFPVAYTDEAAEARADKGGLDARHS